jgi:hypothetical protein
MGMNRLFAIVSCIVLIGLPRVARAHDVDAPSTRPTDAQLAAASAEMATAATNLWNALTPEQQKTVSYKFDDAERLNFHYIPKPRKGLPWAQMTSTQRHLAAALLATGMSPRGFAQTMTVMSEEEILGAMEQGKGPKRDPDLYYFTVFGKPGTMHTWGWRVEGHHVSLNFTIVNGKGVAAAPAFLGANPAEVRDGPRKGLRNLAVEEDLGFRLVKSLDDSQRAKAIYLEKAPADIVTSNKRPADVGEPKGILYSDLNPEQQAMVRVLVRLYAHRHRDELAHQDLAKIESAGWDKVRFAWAGGTEPGVGHYYRLQGPTFIVEFDNTQDHANHIHTVWRDPSGDFGADLLKQHYLRDHADARKKS